MDGIGAKKGLIFDDGSNHFRQRLALSLLSSRPVKIREIRSRSSLNVGLSDYEMSFIELLDKLSNGSKVKINETGTEVLFIPGVLTGDYVTHSCHVSRPLSYYLEPILLLAPYCKKAIHLTIKGKLQNSMEGFNSIYKIRYAGLPLMETFGLEPSIEIKQRSFQNSEILFTCNVKKQLLTLRRQLNEENGKVKKIRGVAYGFRVAPQMLNRIISSAKGVLTQYLKDVYITNDAIKSSNSKLPGYGLALHATTTKNINYAADGFIGREEQNEANEKSLESTNLTSEYVPGPKRKKIELFPEDEDEVSTKKTKRNFHDEENEEELVSFRPVALPSDPEELGEHVAKTLLKEIATRSRVDSVYQWLVLGFMALGPRDHSSVILGQITPFTIQFLRDLKKYFGITFRIQNLKEVNKSIDNDSDSDSEGTEPYLYLLSCVGSGYLNLNKTIL